MHRYRLTAPAGETRNLVRDAISRYSAHSPAFPHLPLRLHGSYKTRTCDLHDVNVAL